MRPNVTVVAWSVCLRDDSGSQVKWVNKSEWVTWVTRDPLTHDFVFFQTLHRLTAQLKPQLQFNSVVSTDYFVAVMMFAFESAST